MRSASCTIRARNCVRLPLLSGPLSTLIWIRRVSAFSCSAIASHLASIVSTMKSLVLYELPKVMCNAPLSSSTIPHGTYFSWHPISWSLARWSPRVRPPRENSPIFTVALQSILQRLMPWAAIAWSSFFSIGEDGVGLFDLLLGLGLDHLAQPKAQAIEHLGHRTGGGQECLTRPLLSERFQGGFGRQPRVGQAGAKRGGLLRLRFGQLTQGVSHLRMLLFPACAATEGRLRPETHDASASLGSAQRHRLAAPPKDGFRPQGIAATILQRHLGLKGAPCGAGHVDAARRRSAIWDGLSTGRLSNVAWCMDMIGPRAES